jgi:hypothetical protein
MQAKLTAPVEALVEEIAANGYMASTAIAVCQLRFAESAPYFRDVLDKATAGRCREETDANLLFVGLHIIGGGRDTVSYPAILRLLRSPEHELDWLLGDACNETLPRIVAGVFDGDADALIDAIADPGVADSIRCALLGALAFLTWDNRIALEKTVSCLERFDDERLGEDDDLAWFGWSEAIALLGLRALAPRVERAIRDGRNDVFLIDPEEWEEALTRAEAAPRDVSRFHEEHLGYIDDVLESLHFFIANCHYPYNKRNALLGDDFWDEDDFDSIGFDEPVINEFRDVGRNDPCPCGSGKKFKHCCLGTL